MSEVRQLTFTDKKRLEAELEELSEAKKRVAEEIQVARGFGDLSENAEYDAAKKEEARVYGRISEIENLLRNATFIDDSDAGTDVVAVGNVVRVMDITYDEEVEYTLVGFTEVGINDDDIKISNESPIGRALIGACRGDEVEAMTPGGKVRMKVLDIRKREAEAL